MNDYGHIDDEIPSLAMALYKDYRNYGIGTALMKKMLQVLKEKGYKQVSLSVQRENYAVKMYKHAGFEIVNEKEEELEPVRRANWAIVYKSMISMTLCTFHFRKIHSDRPKNTN